MEEMLGYIFENFKTQEEDLRKIKRTAKKQRRSIVLQGMLVATLAGVVWEAYNTVKEQEAKISRLNTEIEELKGNKGE